MYTHTQWLKQKELPLFTNLMGNTCSKTLKHCPWRLIFFVGFEQVFSYFESTLTVFSPAFLPLMTGNDFEDYIIYKTVLYMTT